MLFTQHQMKRFSGFIRSAGLALLLISVLFSCSKADPYSDNAFRNMLATLDWGNDVCYVYGHKTPDSDAVCSSHAYAGLMSDTSDLTRNNTTEEDKRAWFAQTGQLNLGPMDAEEIFRNMADALTDYSGMNDYEIYLSDYKDYDLAGVPVGIGCVEWMDYSTMEQFIDRMLAVMPQALADQDRKMVFCMATRYAPNPDPYSSDKAIPTGTYILYCGEGAREAEEAYGPSLRSGVCYSETRLGRKVDVVPTLTEILRRSL